MKYVFVLIVLVHGLIHLMGFSKAFQYSSNSPITKDISRTAGIVWLITCILFMLALIGFLLKHEYWPYIAIIASLLSQFLIFSAWRDAKYGSIANIIVLIVAIISFAGYRFSAMTKQETKELLQEIDTKDRTVLTGSMISELPAVVQKWLKQSGSVGKQKIHCVRLKQKGEMRTSPNGKWIPFEATQYFNADEPAFIWATHIEVFPLIEMNGRDKYADGHGHMLIKLLSLIPVANSKGMETDQGTLLRYLAETTWFPSAAISKYIRWEAIDSSHAKVIMNYGGISANGIFGFNENGDVINYTAQRYYVRGDQSSLETWSISNTAFREFNGIRIPYRSEVTWKLAEGDFTWLKLELTDVNYNIAESY